MIVDDHQLVSCIASGNSSQVWEVVSKTDSQRYAMKLLLPEALKQLEVVKVLKHEGKVGQVFDHPNIIKFHKSSFSRDFGYVLMEYFRAPNLKTSIATDLTGLHIRIRKLIEGLCLSIGYMHQNGWLHKDLKPDNVLFSKSSEMRLIDFSLTAKCAKGFGKLLAGKVKIIQGTRTYIAPETIKKMQPNEQTDMYSLGITLFEVLTGQPPFKGADPTDLLKKHVGAIPPNPSYINANVSPEMDKFILRMLAKKQKDRHKSMDEVYAEFRALKVFKEDVQELADKNAAALTAKNAETFDGRRDKLNSRNDAGRTEAKAADELANPKPATTAAPPTPPAAKPAAPAVAGQGGGPGSPGQPPARPQQPMAPQGMPQPGMAPPGARPGFPPGAMPPGYPAGYPAPGAMPPGQAAMGPGYYPPGYAPPGFPQQYPGQAQGLPFPMQPMPGQPMPGQPMPGQPVGRPPQPGAIPQQLGQRPMPPAQPARPPAPAAAGQPPRPAHPAAASNPRPAAPPSNPAKPVPAAKPATPAPPAESDDLPLMEDLPPIV
jgi:serine/threonine-protein kinase